MSGGRGFSKADAPEESGVIGHGDGSVVIHHADGDPLFGTEPTHTGCVACVELALSGLDAACAPEERILINHHLITRNVREVQEVYLHTRTRTHMHAHTAKTHSRAQEHIRVYSITKVQNIYDIVCVQLSPELLAPFIKMSIH